MASSHRDRLRSWLIGLIALCLVLVGAAAVAVTRPQIESVSAPLAASIPTPIEPPAHVPEMNARQQALVDGDPERVRDAVKAALTRSMPFLHESASDAAGASTLVLPASDHAYDLASVAAEVPDAFIVRHDHGLVLTHPLVVAPGATLLVDSRTAPALYLTSNTTTTVSIWAVMGNLLLVGHPNKPLTIASIASTSGAPDDDASDGRAYILTRGGDMTLSHVRVSRLGFGTGRTSGVAWMNQTTAPATGGAADTVFSDNFFGAYASGAQGLTITRSSFLDNTIYGFDPHTGSNGMVITNSVAARNGRHGFIISRDCSHNQFRDDEAYENGGAGFMIDDGNPATETPGPSSDNVLLRVWSHDNRWSGIVIEGGSRNVIDMARVEGNSYGIWVRGQARDSTIQNSHVTASGRVDLRLDQATAGTRVTLTALETAPVGLDLVQAGSVTIQNDRITSATETAVRITGQLTGVRSRGLVVAGTGSRVLTVNGSVMSTDSLPGIDDSGWVNGSVTSSVAETDVKGVARDGHLLLVATVLALPFLLAWPLRRRRARAHRSELLPTHELSIRAH
jgi:uncharacterized membrane protein